MTPEGSESDLLDRVSAYVVRAGRNRDNFERMRAEGALDKASEMLWGLFSSYTNALATLKLGRPLSRHGQLVEFARELAKERLDERMAEAVSEAETMHANFYHGFLDDPLGLRRAYEDISYYAGVIDSMIRATKI